MNASIRERVFSVRVLCTATGGKRPSNPLTGTGTRYRITVAPTRAIDRRANTTTSPATTFCGRMEGIMPCNRPADIKHPSDGAATELLIVNQI